MAGIFDPQAVVGSDASAPVGASSPKSESDSKLLCLSCEAFEAYRSDHVLLLAASSPVQELVLLLAVLALLSRFGQGFDCCLSSCILRHFKGRVTKGIRAEHFFGTNGPCCRARGGAVPLR